MSTLISPTSQSNRPPSLRAVPVLVVLVLSIAALLFAPGSLAAKTHLALHGICAQRSSHSLQMGGVTLPLDARMTGIYIAAAVTLGWLAAAGRLQNRRLPSRPVLLILTSLVVVLGLDGFNALLADLGVWRPYEPLNLLRLATGILGGTSLGVGLAYLFAVSIWVEGSSEMAIVGRPRELIAPLTIAGALAVLAMSGLPVLYAPFAIGLLLAAFGVFWTLSIVLLALALNRGWSYRSYGEMASLALAALFAATAIIAALSGLRLFAERVLGLPQLT